MYHTESTNHMGRKSCPTDAASAIRLGRDRAGATTSAAAAGCRNDAAFADTLGYYLQVNDRE